jgi:hypothetical protein
VAANTFELGASNLPAGQPGIFFYGPNQIEIPFGDDGTPGAAVPGAGSARWAGPNQRLATPKCGSRGPVPPSCRRKARRLRCSSLRSGGSRH